MKSVRKFTYLIAILSQLHFAYGQATKSAAPPAPPAFDKSKVAELLAKLKSGDQAEISAAKSEIEAVISTNKLKGFQSLAADFLPALVKAEKYEVADDLARFGIRTVPYDANDLPVAFNARIKAAQARKQPEEALKLARSLFNVSSMKDTAEALATVADCLKVAHPDKPELVEQFKQEQIRGSGFGSADIAGTAAGSLLKSLPADDDPDYQMAISEIPSSNKMVHLSRGNLLLMAGRPAEARTEFEAGVADAYDDQYRTRCREGIAKSIKAEDGLLGRANGGSDSI